MEYHSVLLMKIFLAMAVFVLIFVSMAGFGNKKKKGKEAGPEGDAPHNPKEH